MAIGKPIFQIKGVDLIRQIKYLKKIKYNTLKIWIFKILFHLKKHF